MNRGGCLLVVACAWMPWANAGEPVPARFDAGFLRGGRVDTARFALGMPAEPGTHWLDVRRNGLALGRHPVRVDTQPCVDAALARVLQLEMARLAREARVALADPAACVALDALVAGATLVHDPGELALEATIPLAALRPRAEDAIDPALFDAGMPALRFAYGLTVAHTDARIDDTQGTARTELGANVGGWRWRHRATHAWGSGTPLRSRTIASLLERDVVSMQAQVTVGDFHTRGVLFDSIGLRGVRMQSDERMWPPSRTRPSPVVRGIAASNARVQVRQGDVLLVDTTVPPGPFVLDDIRPPGFGRALEVRVIEADGRIATFAVPWTAVPGALRRGQSRFAVAAGQGRGVRASDAMVAESTWEAGVGDHVTARAGAQLTTDYAHVLGGAAWATRAGAMSIDASASHYAARAGGSVRVAYAGLLSTTRTTFDIAAWRHASAGFRTLSDALHPAREDAPPHERTRLDLRVRQDLRRAGTLSLTHVERRPATRRSTQLGYGLAFGRNGATLQATYERARHPPRSAASLSLAMPLRLGDARQSAQSNVRTSPDASAMQAGVQGTTGRDDHIAWSLGALHSAPRGRAAATTSNGSLAWRGNAMRIGAALSSSPTANSASMTLDGALLFHRHGATFAPVLGDTLALLRAPQAAGARLASDPARRLDRNGHAIVASLSPYRRNRVGIDPRGAPASTHFEFTERDVIPRAGAVVDVVLPTTHAPARWLRLVREGGAPPPFSAQVLDARGIELGRVGRDGIAWVRTPPSTTHLDVRWQEEGDAMTCRVALGDGIADVLIDAVCTTSAQ